METKSARTTRYIIETVAPVFNRHGYDGTSLSDICKATGLTKGAIYGNFRDKEDLAVQVFDYSFSKMTGSLRTYISGGSNGLEKLYLLLAYYRNYYEYSFTWGGCPIVNLGSDSLHGSEELKSRALAAVTELEGIFSDVIFLGQKDASILKSIYPREEARIQMAAIHGAVLFSFIHGNKSILQSVLDRIKERVRTEFMRDE